MKNWVYIILAVTGILCAEPAFAQGWQWGRLSNGAMAEGWCVATDAAGDVYCAANVGLTPSTPLTLGTYVFTSAMFAGVVYAKYDPSGTLLWANSLPGDMRAITVDPSGNLIILRTDSMSKTDPSGTVLWRESTPYCSPPATTIGFTSEAGEGVKTDAAGNIYVTGGFYGATATIGTYTLTNTDPAALTTDIFVAKYTPAGAVVWATSIGGASDDFVNDITVTNTGFVYIAGDFNSSSITIGSSVISNPYTNRLSFIAKFSAATGTALWGQAQGGSVGAYAAGIGSDNSGNIYLAGSFGNASISFGSYTLSRTYSFVPSAVTGYLVQFSPAGVVTWGKIVEQASGSVLVYGLTVAPCNRVWICGSYDEDALVDAGDTLRHILGPDPAFIIGYNIGGSAFDHKGIQTGAEEQNAIASDPSGNIFFANDFLPTTTYPSMTIGPDVLTGGSTYESLMLLKYDIATDSVFAHNDTSLCSGAGITLKAPSGYSSWRWDSGATDSTHTITATGNYYVACSKCGQVLIDTFHVTLGTADTTYQHNDSSLCASAVSITLSAPAGYSTYTWNSGATTSSIAITVSGTYFVAATLGCDMVVDTFEVTAVPSPVVSLGNDTIFCVGQPIILSSAQPPRTTFLWSTGSTQTSIIVLTGGIYWLKVTDANGCYTVDTALVATPAQGMSSHLINVTPDETISYGSSVQLNADGELIYMWKPDDGSLNNPNINNPVATPVVKTIYTVYGYDHRGCIDSAAVTISVDTTMNECIPSAFTPNGDGRNDIFRPACIKFQELVDFRIYNRWGQQVFYSNNYKNGWDGTFNGVPQDFGVYYYYMIVARQGDKNVTYKGDVTLIR